MALYNIACLTISLHYLLLDVNMLILRWGLPCLYRKILLLPLASHVDIFCYGITFFKQFLPFSTCFKWRNYIPDPSSVSFIKELFFAFSFSRSNFTPCKWVVIVLIHRCSSISTCLQRCTERKTFSEGVLSTPLTHCLYPRRDGREPECTRSLPVSCPP